MNKEHKATLVAELTALVPKWRKDASEIGRNRDPDGIWNSTLKQCADELEAALSAQQGSNFYAITNKNDNDLFWSNEIGWVDAPPFDLFTQEERETLSLPDEGRWVQVTWKEFDAQQSAADTVSVQQAWEWAGGNPGIKATRDDLQQALRDLDAVCDAADVELPPLPDGWNARILNEWGRACVANATAAKDAEIEVLRKEAQFLRSHRPIARKLAEAEARAERLAEALRGIVSDIRHFTKAGTVFSRFTAGWADQIDALLRDQEKNDA